jgi:hypothetical protein
LAVSVGVADKPNPRARMVCTDSDSRQNRRPDFVTKGRHVIAQAIEPIDRLGNLFAKEDARAACSDEAPLCWPHISRNRAASARARESLAGAGERPDGPIVRPAGESQGEAPSAHTGEPVALSKSSNVG